MKELQIFYEKQVDELKEIYERYVASNKKKNSICHALRQIKSEGDITVDVVEELLNKELEREKHINDKLTSKCYCLKEFVRSIELELELYGVEVNKVKEIFGY